MKDNQNKLTTNNSSNGFTSSSRNELKGFRKRLLVTEGDLQALWYEVMQVRNVEKKEAFKTSFKSLLNGAQFVSLIPSTSQLKEGGSNE